MTAESNIWFPSVKKYQAVLIGILLVSLILRLIAVFGGGQLFWPDEARYHLSHRAVAELRDGDVLSAVATLFARAHHMGYKALGVIPAAVEDIWGSNLHIPGVFVSLFSLLNIYLMWVFARKLGADEVVALLTVFFFSVSVEIFIWTRHIVPYDEAMTFGLLAMITAVSARRSVGLSFFAGLLASACFLTYLGYWTFAGVAALFSAGFERGNLRGIFVRWVALGVGFFIVPLFLFVGTRLVGYDLFGSMVEFAGTVVLGDCSEGWSFPVEYMWRTEYMLAVFWLIAFVWSVVLIVRGERRPLFIVPVAASLFLYAALVLFSVGLDKFVVYGRLVRQFVPFLSILFAAVMGIIIKAGKQKVVWFICGVVLVQAMCNFYVPLTMVFPAEFSKEAKTMVIESETGKLVVLYATFIQPQFKGAPLSEFLKEPDPKMLPPNTSIILQARHPQQYGAFQYEGYTPEQRKIFREIDFSMRAVICNE
jgi:hypothetical protein